MKEALKEIIKSKRGLYLISTVVLILFALAINIAFGAFSSRNTKVVANIKVNNMEYAMTINGTPGTIITVLSKGTPGFNVGIVSLNKLDSKYELIYKVCSDQTCTSYIQKPSTLLVEYSSKTVDSITGSIVSSGNKSIRIIVTNTSDEPVYIKFDMNAGYTHNTLDLLGLINSEFNEEDIIIAAYIYGEFTTTFPTTSDYGAEVVCTVNNEPTTATGKAKWDGTRWSISIDNATTSRTYCNVYFGDKVRCDDCLKDKILAQGGGAAAIEAKPAPNFGAIATSADTGLYATADEYGTSYYYRGLKDNLNNNVIFAGFQWKIIRIDGEGNIHLIYNGTEAQFTAASTVNSTGTNTQIGKSDFNSGYTENRYVGYMYGTSATTYETAHSNITNSNIKTYIENWYNSNIANKGESVTTKIVDTIYCNDRTLASGTGAGTVVSYYGAYGRLYTKKSPSLKCTRVADQFGVSVGNAKLTRPVGLITADEVSFAGGVNGTNNSTYYLYTVESYWTMSPYSFHDSVASGWRVVSTSSLTNYHVNGILGVRPVLALNSTVESYSGDGSAENPYRI